MKITGQILKENREKQNISIEDVAAALKVSPRILRAIESGDQTDLPAKAFIRGFVRAYASFLKLDVTNILTTFQEEMGSTKPLPQTKPLPHESSAPTAQSVLDNKASLAKVVGVAALLLAIVLVVTLVRVVEKYEKEAEPNPPPEDIALLDAIATTTPAPTTTPVSETTPSPSLTPAATTTNTPTPTPAPKPSPAATPAPQKPIVQNHEVIVEALDQVEISYAIDGQAAKTNKLAANAVFVLKAEKSLKLKVANGGSVNIIHNGKDLGVPGSLGAPKELIFP